MRLITLGIGAALGYLLGSQEGRRNLEKMSNNAKNFWQDPKTQQKVHEATETVKAKAPVVAEQVTTTAKDVTEKVTDKVNEIKDNQDAKGQKDAAGADLTQGNVKAGSEKITVGTDTVSDPSQSLENEGGGPDRY
ncbi:YtxH domain-containing protein [Micrococcus terreus]|uniref:YtxH domain-containing protein n=1 Tax=Micrococcus terreus TaxID=574650 RepID=A0A1I7MNQ3_9MICC|nr:YtxH domain-containing protein [Micrococcus terreus]MCT2089315.1 YtxH domain-containing protein [Micrococcus terreus]MDK7702009.1 YtxH domain-containing protein [Micrococcus terreus]WOO97311.1 YtxH domain-containing protein [Micrococcus terreus]SFV23509.1 hypothetical protein SAMN04487966_107128 [Micrococcus terreus]